ncbi:MAG TPA: hypothetical protein VNM89_07460 [Solirubrobacterales bacterium]|nr:hypothetical protein [Solirubrobacterales bacterium]
MSKRPTNAPDPQPGDFDAELEAISEEDLEFVEAGSGIAISIEVLIEGEDARRLAKIASERGQPPGEVVADLVRSAA